MKKKMFIFIGVYTISCCLTLVSLYYNAKTMPLLKNTESLSKTNQNLELENKQLQNKISTQKSIKHIHETAKKYKMKFPELKKITHINLNQNQ